MIRGDLKPYKCSNKFHYEYGETTDYPVIQISLCSRSVGFSFSFIIFPFTVFCQLFYFIRIFCVITVSLAFQILRKKLVNNQQNWSPYACSTFNCCVVGHHQITSRRLATPLTNYVVYSAIYQHMVPMSSFPTPWYITSLLAKFSNTFFTSSPKLLNLNEQDVKMCTYPGHVVVWYVRSHMNDSCIIQNGILSLEKTQRF